MLTGPIVAIALFALVAATLIQRHSTRVDATDFAAHDQPRRTPPPDHRAIHGVTGMLHAAARF